jgi:hypothetical protein
MIRGYLSSSATNSRPYVEALLRFPTLGDFILTVQFLVDTGADRTVLGHLDAKRLGIDLASLPAGVPTTGVGGKTPTRTVAVELTMDSFTTSLDIVVLASAIGPHRRPVPSLLGRDVLSRFALFLDAATERVFLRRVRRPIDSPCPETLAALRSAR